MLLTDIDIQAVRAWVRQRVLRWFVRQGYLDKDDAKDMAQWGSGGGFSVDASVRIEANDRAGLERLLCYHPPHLPNCCVSVSYGSIPAVRPIFVGVR